MKQLVISIPLKSNLQIEYTRELTIKLNDMLKDDYQANLEFLPKGESEPIGIGVFKK